MSNAPSPPKPDLSQEIQTKCIHCLIKIPDSLHDEHKSQCINKYYNMICVFIVFFSIFGGLTAITLIPS
jgi:hypothetical protein